ncbi:MAG: hypothetical protein EOO43_24110 [Flavobacterium sp.]|nr:MAG: hypothetical protein EOO43_24110 [Flavobacterium sp.]
MPEEVAANYKGLGITAGFLSGLGFSYRQYFADRLGFKATGIAFFDQNQTFGNIGLQGMYVLSENDWLRFYGLVGVSNFTTRRANYSYNNPSSTDSDYVYIPSKGSSNFEAYNSVGAGIGIELGRLSQGLSFAIELPVVATFRGTSFSSLYPIPSLSVIYNF